MKKALHSFIGIILSLIIMISGFSAAASQSIRGDVNNDGVFNILDFIRLKKYFTSEADVDNYSADVDGNAKINSGDLVALRKLLLGADFDLLSVFSNMLYSAAYGTAYGSTDIVYGAAHQLNSADAEGQNFDASGNYIPGDSYLAYEGIPVSTAGYYRIRLDLGFDDTFTQEGWSTRLVVTVNGKASYITVQSDGDKEGVIVWLNGDGSDEVRIEEFTGGNYTFAVLNGIYISPLDIDYFKEAEKASEINGIVVETTDLSSADSASGLAYVNSLNTTELKNIVFNDITVDKDGEYVLNIRLLSGSDATLTAAVNSGAPLEIRHFTSANWNKFVNVQRKVTLNEGANTIVLGYGSDSTYSAVDYIYLSDSEDLIEIEDSSRVTADSGVPAEQSDASGGYVFNNIDSGTVQITLPEAKAGYYTFTVGAVSAFGIDIPVYINGDSAATIGLSAYPNMFSEITYYAFEGILKGDGTDVIALAFSGNWAWLDYISARYNGNIANLTYPDTANGPDDDTHKRESLRLEAEDADKFGLAATADCIASDANASAGKYIFGLNFDKSHSNRIEFGSIDLTHGGTYRLSVRYSGATNSSFTVDVNGTPYVAPYSMTDPNWAFVPYTMVFNVTLNGDGTDVITMYDNDGYIRVDYIQLDCMDGVQIYQAEDAEINGTAAIMETSGLSSGTYIGGMAYDETHSNNVTFKINAEDAGSYRLGLVYSTGANGGVGVTLNGTYNGLFDTPLTNNYWGFTPNISYVTVTLKKGENTVCIYDPAGNPSYAHVDYLTVE